MRYLLIVLFGVAFAQQVPVTVTYYQPVVWQTDQTPTIGACGPMQDFEQRGFRLVALSRDLFSRKVCGEVIFLLLDDGTRILGVVWDTMNIRFTNRVDVLYTTEEPRPEWGKAHGIMEHVDGY